MPYIYDELRAEQFVNLLHGGRHAEHTTECCQVFNLCDSCSLAGRAAMRVKVAEIAWHETQRVLSVDTDSSGRLATGGADGSLCIWNYKWPSSAAHPAVTCLAHLAARHTKPVNAVRFAPHGDYLASGGDGAFSPRP